jgi:hypothetical protein
VNHVGQRAAGIADGREYLPDAALTVVFDNETGGGGDVGLEIGIYPARVANSCVDTRFMQPPRQRPAFDEEVQLEAALLNIVVSANDELVLTDADYAHVRRPSRGLTPRP